MSGTANPLTSRSRRSSTNFSMQPGSIARNQGRARARHFWRQRDDRPHFARRFASRKRRPPENISSRTASTAEDFNSYGSRRGNDRVMTRGTFANVRIKNLMVPGVEGGVTKFQPDGEQLSIYDAAMKYQAAKHAARHHRRTGIRHRQFARLGGERHEPARRESRRRAELRAHPSQQPRRHGRAAVAIQGRHDRADA